MDQTKIGKFISSKRKEKNITQSELAEKLGISDRAISKWENGICMPDANNMPELCKILDITINDLFSAKVVDMKEYNRKAEQNLLEMAQRKEILDKFLLKMELVIGYTSSITFIGLIFIASFIAMPKWLVVLLITFGSISFAVGITNCIKIEQMAGYYECNNCHYRYVPTYNSVLFANHINRTRKMKCPKCQKKTWHKKVLKR